MNNKLFVSCVESRIEQETNWYSRFEIGPFQSGQALTVANSLRRTLLADQTGVFLTAVEIEGAVHEYSRLQGIKEPILDILLNLRQLSLFLNDNIENQETLIGYFDLQGPLEVKAKHFKFPQKIECANPNQHIATLTRNCKFQGRFLITVNPSTTFKNHSIGDPVNFKTSGINKIVSDRFNETNWLYVNPITNTIRRVNYIVEQFGDVWEQQEVVVLELWTNGTLHPKQAIQNAAIKLSTIFSLISSIPIASFKFPTTVGKFKKIKTSYFHEGFQSLKNSTNENSITNGQIESDKVTILFDLDITNLNLSLKTYFALRKLKIENVGNLFQYKKSELRTLANLTEQQMDEIHFSLSSFGFNL